MVSSLALRSHPLLPACAPSRLFPKPSLLSTLASSSSSSSQTLPLTIALIPHHGPSLRRGRPPRSPSPAAAPPPDGVVSIDRASFTRSFDLAALRVPAAECAALEARLRGHLLNWPRLRNVARVPGDDVDPDFRRIMRDSRVDGSDRLDSISRRGYNGEDEEPPLPLSPVLYREKLAKEFNCRGFLKFRNLAKISRPKKKKKTREREKVGLEAKERVERSEYCVVEVVEQGSDGNEEEDFSGLLGDGYQSGRWRGPTRLLLLDEWYAKKGVEELPEAVKMVLQSNNRQEEPSLFELVQCQLTLYYNYWQMNELLEALLPVGIIVPTGFETIGHIAHLNLRDEHNPYKKLIAQVVLDKHRPKIQTVVNKIDAIQNDYRTMQLEVLAGNHSVVTTVIENGIRFQIDLGTVYWNSKLATERQRLVNYFVPSDVVCDVFAGAGPIAISAAKKVRYVYANDLNPNAVEYMERNVVLNKLDRKIDVFNMDGRRFINALFAIQRPLPITQVVMNLPNDAAHFLDAFRGIFSKRQKEDSCTLPKIHVYGFSKAENPEFDFHERINMALCEAVAEIEMHRVRLVAPGKWMLCASFVLPQAVAFAKQTGPSTNS